MQSPRRVCQYLVSKYPPQICRKPLYGQGRHKFCQPHARVGYAQHQCLTNTQRVRDFRQHHPEYYAIEKAINGSNSFLRKTYGPDHTIRYFWQLILPRQAPGPRPDIAFVERRVRDLFPWTDYFKDVLHLSSLPEPKPYPFVADCVWPLLTSSMQQTISKIHLEGSSAGLTFPLPWWCGLPDQFRDLFLGIGDAVLCDDGYRLWVQKRDLSFEFDLPTNSCRIWFPGKDGQVPREARRRKIPDLPPCYHGLFDLELGLEGYFGLEFLNSQKLFLWPLAVD